MPVHKSARINLSLTLFTYFAVCVLLGLSVFSLRLYFTQKNSPQVLGEESVSLTEDKKFWQEIVLESPTYQDGWIMLAKTNLALGNIKEAKAAFEKAKEINPNSEEVVELKSSF